MKTKSSNQLRDHQILTPEQFAAIVREAAKMTGMHIPEEFDGKRRNARASTSCDVWGSEASVSVDDRYAEFVEIEPGVMEDRSRIEVSITWSSTARTVSQSLVAIAAYQRAVNFAAQVEAATAGKFFVRRIGEERNA